MQSFMGQVSRPSQHSNGTELFLLSVWLDPQTPQGSKNREIQKATADFLAKEIKIRAAVSVHRDGFNADNIRVKPPAS
jgi:hypothetical protein